MDPFLSPTLLPLGEPEKNYTYTLTVRIVDKYGSYSEDSIFVTVSNYHNADASERISPDLITKYGIFSSVAFI